MCIGSKGHSLFLRAGPRFGALALGFPLCVLSVSAPEGLCADEIRKLSQEKPINYRGDCKIPMFFVHNLQMRYPTN